MAVPQPWEAPSPPPCSPPCAKRLLAVIEERFVPAKSLGGWVWLDSPLRYKSWRTAYHHPEAPDNTGLPYVFAEVCPFCGGQLPAPTDDDWGIDGEAGG